MGETVLFDSLRFFVQNVWLAKALLGLKLIPASDCVLFIHNLILWWAHWHDMAQDKSADNILYSIKGFYKVLVALHMTFVMFEYIYEKKKLPPRKLSCKKELFFSTIALKQVHLAQKQQIITKIEICLLYRGCGFLTWAFEE